ncbi:hypothetical protein PtB15_5B721 [Puccinia triticina]|nr:hypothetical protein PtB15_5B721 [Puccinia triticina]
MSTPQTELSIGLMLLMAVLDPQLEADNTSATLTSDQQNPWEGPYKVLATGAQSNSMSPKTKKCAADPQPQSCSSKKSWKTVKDEAEESEESDEEEPFKDTPIELVHHRTLPLKGLMVWNKICCAAQYASTVEQTIECRIEPGAHVYWMFSQIFAQLKFTWQENRKSGQSSATNKRSTFLLALEAWVDIKDCNTAHFWHVMNGFRRRLGRIHSSTQSTSTSPL